MEGRAYLTFLYIYIMFYHEVRKPGFGGLHFFNIHLLLTRSEALCEYIIYLQFHSIIHFVFNQYSSLVAVHIYMYAHT